MDILVHAGHCDLSLSPFYDVAINVDETEVRTGKGRQFVVTAPHRERSQAHPVKLSGKLKNNPVVREASTTLILAGREDQQTCQQ